MNTTTIGFIGTGVMGTGMIRNLRKAGFPVNIYTRTKGRRPHRRRLPVVRLAGCRRFCVGRRHFHRRLSERRGRSLFGR